LGGGDNKTKTESVEGNDLNYENPEEFRKATELPRTGRRGGGVAHDDPVVALLARIGLGCLTGAGDPVAEREREKRESEDDDAGESEDGNEAQGDNSERLPAPADGNVFTLKQVERRRKNLIRALRLFDTYLEEINKDPAATTDDVPARVSFMLRLLLEATLLAHNIEDGRTVLLMTMMDEDRESSFVVRATRILRDIWVGRGLRFPPIVQRLKPAGPNVRLPVEVSAFATQSRWIAGRCCEAVNSSSGYPDLATFVRKACVRIVSGTYLLGIPAPDEEMKNLVLLEEHANGTVDSAARIMAWLSETGASLSHTPGNTLSSVPTASSDRSPPRPMRRRARSF
jgi:hypothetical protein